MRLSERINKYEKWYDPLFGAEREWKIGYVASLSYMICDGCYGRDLDTDNILSLLTEWYS